MSGWKVNNLQRILVTGGAGFVGYHLSKKLTDQGHVVHIIDNFSRPNEDREFKQLISKGNVFHYKRDVSDPSLYDELPLDF